MTFFFHQLTSTAFLRCRHLRLSDLTTSSTSAVATTHSKFLTSLLRHRHQDRFPAGQIRISAYRAAEINRVREGGSDSGKVRASREKCERKRLIGRQVGVGEAAGLFSEVGHKWAGGRWCTWYRSFNILSCKSPWT